MNNWKKRVVLCGAAAIISVFSAAGTFAADNMQPPSRDTVTFNRIADGTNRPLTIKLAEFLAGDSVSDSYIANLGDICSLSFLWEGSGTAELTLHALPPNDKPDKTIPIENGIPMSFELTDINGYYLITITNNSSLALKNFAGVMTVGKAESPDIPAIPSSPEQLEFIAPGSRYTQIASFSKEADTLQTVLPIHIEEDNQKLSLGFRCDNAVNYLTAFVVPAGLKDYFSQQDFMSCIEPYQNGIYVGYPFANDRNLKDSVVMISRGFYGSTRFDESQITAENTGRKGDYYIYFIAQEANDCSLSVKVSS